jgi:hypothetical protein
LVMYVSLMQLSIDSTRKEHEHGHQEQRTSRRT